MKSIIEFFSSVKLAIFLIIIVTVSSVLGTLIPQLRSPEEYVSRFGQMAGLLHRLQLTRLYQSWWFLALLFVLALNITVCTLVRLSSKLRKALRPRIEVEEKELVVLKVKEKFRKNAGLDNARERVKKELSLRRYRLREEVNDRRAFLLGRKRLLGWFGSDVVHLGILVILSGGIISGIAGSKRFLTFAEGQTLEVPGADFRLRLDKFETEYYPNGSVRDWKSTLTVFEDEQPVLTRVIEVNHPLSYKRYLFYQSSYGWNWAETSVKLRVKKRADPAFFEEIVLRAGEKAFLEGGKIEVSLLTFIPDFLINEKNQVVTRSLQPNNPAAFLEGWQDGQRIFSGWIFARFPDFSRIHGTKEADFVFELRDFEAGQFSVIQASRDPGANFIWSGCALVMAGLFLAFYWPTREIRVRLEETSGRTEVLAGGIAAKSREAFQAEFQKIIQSLRSSK